MWRGGSGNRCRDDDDDDDDVVVVVVVVVALVRRVGVGQSGIGYKMGVGYRPARPALNHLRPHVKKGDAF